LAVTVSQPYGKQFMAIKVSEHFIRIVSVRLEDRIDAFNVSEVRDKLYSLIDNGSTRLVVDLALVTFLDSMSMSILVSAMKRARKADGDLKLVWPQAKELQQTIRLAKFDVVFQIYDSVAAAIESY
jgi:anti-sigma B factor antagonist